MKSSSRNGRKTIWLAVHTTEGLMSSVALRQFFDRANAQGSSHAGADSTGLLLDGAADGYVDHSRAAWTLRNGNPISENLEQCAWAGWTRAEWLARPKLLDAAARWLARRSKATGVPLRLIGPNGVAARQSGVIEHDDYSKGTGDGSHWDCGPNYPWDVVLPLAQSYLNGNAPKPQPEPEDDDMAGVFITDGNARPWWLYDGFTRRYVAPGEPQILVDLGIVKQNMVKKVAPAVIERIPRSDVDLVDESAIAREVAERWKQMTDEERAKEEAHALPGVLAA